jgi:hypothetical protein
MFPRMTGYMTFAPWVHSEGTYLHGLGSPHRKDTAKMEKSDQMQTTRIIIWTRLVVCGATRSESSTTLILAAVMDAMPMISAVYVIYMVMVSNVSTTKRGNAGAADLIVLIAVSRAEGRHVSPHTSVDSQVKAY